MNEQKRVLTDNYTFIIENLEADDVIDELIQEKIMGRSVQLVGMSRVDKNRIIVDQLSTTGPGTLKMFCEILRGTRGKCLLQKSWMLNVS